MGRFDSWQPFIPSYSKGIDYLGDALAQVRTERRKQADSDQKARFENEQNAAIMAGKKEQERRDRVKEAQDQADKRVKLTQNLGMLLGKGRVSEAQALAGASQFENPDTHQMQGVQLGQAPPTQAESDVAGLSRDYSGLEQQSRALSRFMGRTVDAAAGLGDQETPEQSTAAEAQQPAAPVYTPPQRYRATFPGGATADIDPEESRRAVAQQAQEDADAAERAAVTETDPVRKEQLLAMSRERRARVTNAERAAIGNRVAQEDAQAEKRAHDAQYEMTAGQKFTVGMHKGSGSGGFMKDLFEKYKTEQKRVQAETAYEPVVQNVLHKYGFEKLQEQHQQLSELFDISSVANQNPAASTLLGGRYAKFSQGAGVLSDSDMNRFYYDIGGRLGLMDANGSVDFHKLQTVLQSYFLGTTNPKLTKQIEGALGTLEGSIDRRSKEIGQKIETRLRGMGADESTIDSYLETYAPTYSKAGAGGTRGDRGNESITHPTAPAGPRTAPAGPRAAPGGPPPPAGGGPPSLEAAVNRARARLKANPNDATAAQFLRDQGVSP